MRMAATAALNDSPRPSRTRKSGVENKPSTTRPRGDRAETRCLSAHVPEEMYWELKRIAVDYRADMQDVIAAAANALFARLKRPAIPVKGVRIDRALRTLEPSD